MSYERPDEPEPAPAEPPPGQLSLLEQEWQLPLEESLEFGAWIDSLRASGSQA